MAPVVLPAVAREAMEVMGEIAAAVVAAEVETVSQPGQMGLPSQDSTL
jgi:hypothetical protein